MPKKAMALRRGKEAAPKGESQAQGKSAPRRTCSAASFRALSRAEIAPDVGQRVQLLEPMQVPHVDKVVVNIGIGEALTNAKALDAAVKDLTTITGQKPLVRKAKNPSRHSNCAKAMRLVSR